MATGGRLMGTATKVRRLTSANAQVGLPDVPTRAVGLRSPTEVTMMNRVALTVTLSLLVLELPVNVSLVQTMQLDRCGQPSNKAFVGVTLSPWDS